MGSDPRRLDGLRADEKFAAVLVERATGATARAHDVGTRQGAHDVDLLYPGGRTAALEVTTHAGSGVRQTAALLGRARLTWPNPGRWSWAIDIGDPTEIQRLRAVYPRAIEACESHDVSGPAGLPRGVLDPDPELHWLAGRSTSTLTGRPPTTRDHRPPGGVLVTMTARAAFMDSRLAGLPKAVTELLAVPHVAKRAAKVAAVQRVDERHLFLGIGEGGLPDTLYLPLTAPLDALPTDDPDVPDGISHLWLTTAWSGAPLVGWDRVHGWRAHQVERKASRRGATRA